MFISILCPSSSRSPGSPPTRGSVDWRPGLAEPDSHLVMEAHRPGVASRPPWRPSTIQTFRRSPEGWNTWGVERPLRRLLCGHNIKCRSQSCPPLPQAQPQIEELIGLVICVANNSFSAQDLSALEGGLQGATKLLPQIARETQSLTGIRKLDMLGRRLAFHRHRNLRSQVADFVEVVEVKDGLRLFSRKQGLPADVPIRRNFSQHLGDVADRCLARSAGRSISSADPPKASQKRTAEIRTQAFGRG